MHNGGKKLYQIVGENAKLSQTIRDNLDVAREMEKAGKDSKDIFLATGWERGVDGKWKYDLITGIRILPSVRNAIDDKLYKDSYSLDEFVSFIGSDLTSAYPELKNVRFFIGEDKAILIYEKEKKLSFENEERIKK